MRKKVGFHAVPDDANIEQFLTEMWTEHQSELDEIVGELKGTICETKKLEQPEIFAYGKLMNFLASGVIPEPDIHKLLAAALWELK